MKIKINNLIYLIFVISFLFYVMSSTYALKGGIYLLYYAKHISIVLLVIIGIFLLNRFINKSHIINISCIFFISMPFLFQGETGFVVFIQYISLALSALVLSKIWRKNISYALILTVFCISILPSFIDIIFNNKEFIYNDYWGRDRLLLGYIHPKEAGIAFIIPILFFRLKINQEKYPLYFKVFFDGMIILLLFFIQSRNMVAFYLNFLVLSATIMYLGFKPSLLLFACIYLILPIIGLIIYYDEINILLSNRLFRWEDANITWMGIGTSINPSVNKITNEFSLITKFHIDNFYLEYLVENGVFPFIVLAASLIYFVVKIGVEKVGNTYINSLFIPFLLYCIFDSGMFSTGNFLNIFIWSIYFSKISYNEKNDLNQSFDCNHEMTGGYL